LHSAPKYQKLNSTPAELVTKLLQDISGLIHHIHFDFLLQQDLRELPYFYTLPKPLKNPIGWRPVAATQRSVLSIHQRTCVTVPRTVVMKTLKEFHHKEFQQTGIRNFWIVENSLEVVISLPETLTSITSSDIDLMYRNMDQNCVI
jgi:hypothetical protein